DHALLAHRHRFDHLEPGDLVLALLLSQERARNDADHLPAGLERAAGERTHEADVAASVDHRPAAPGDPAPHLFGERPVDGRGAVARAAEHADGQLLRRAHVSCAFGSRDSSASTASLAPLRPSRTETTASVIGSSTPWRLPRPCAARAHGTPSATCPRLETIESSGSPAASASPTRRLRDRSPVQVRTRAPTPARPRKVSRLAPSASPRRAISARPRVIRAARALNPSSRPSQIPAAMAITFFIAPPISTPTRSSLA